MGRLRSALQSRYKDRDEDVKVYTPRNLEQLDITFRGERVAKVWTPALPPLYPTSSDHPRTGHRHPRRSAPAGGLYALWSARSEGLLVHTPRTA